MDSFLKSVFVRAGKHTSVHDVHPHINATSSLKQHVIEPTHYQGHTLDGIITRCSNNYIDNINVLEITLYYETIMLSWPSCVFKV